MLLKYINQGSFFFFFLGGGGVGESNKNERGVI